MGSLFGSGSRPTSSDPFVGGGGFGGPRSVSPAGNRTELGGFGRVGPAQGDVGEIIANNLKSSPSALKSSLHNLDAGKFAADKKAFVDKFRDVLNLDPDTIAEFEGRINAARTAKDLTSLQTDLDRAIAGEGVYGDRQARRSYLERVADRPGLLQTRKNLLTGKSKGLLG